MGDTLGVKPVSDAQARKLMEEMTKHGKVGLAAMKAGMDRKTARKYVTAGKLPSEMTAARDWRTREDPFAEHWPEVEALVRETPALEAKTLFELLTTKYPARYEPGQLRTLQRRVRLWRATQGPDKAVTFAQQHRPGEAAQTDFTSTSELGITIGGQLFVHGRDGCRHRATPPSVRFLGRRVYVGAVVILASVVALAAASFRAAERATGIAARTSRRWLHWWQGPFTTSAPLVELSGRLVPSPSRSALPTSVLERLPGDAATRVRRLLAWLAPIPTASSPGGSRFLRGLV